MYKNLVVMTLIKRLQHHWLFLESIKKITIYAVLNKIILIKEISLNFLYNICGYKL